MFVWGGYTSNDKAPYLYDPVTNLWTKGSTAGAPAARFAATAVWTGSKVIIWGGSDTKTGFTYDPLLNVWAQISSAGAPSARKGHSAVFTGSKMIIWGGHSGSLGNLGGKSDGGIYDPSTDTWAPMPQTNTPAGRGFHSAVWTGSKMLMWGSLIPGGASADQWGAIYDPTTGIWQPISSTGAPTGARGMTQAAWTGTQMIIYTGGTPKETYASGAVYTPATDSWSPISKTGAPGARIGPSAIWAGDAMIFMGGVKSKLFADMYLYR
jgi:N-acetylneuraminic acid mutarotase